MRYKTSIPVKLLFIIFVCCCAQANDTVTVTVHRGAQQTFQGFGAGTTNSTSYQLLPQNVRDSLASLVWGDLDFKVLRLFSPLGEYASEYFAARYGMYINDVLVHRPELQILLTPDMANNIMYNPPANDSELRDYARMFAAQIKDLRVRFGITINATGICNEPNENVRMSDNLSVRRMDAGQVARAVKYFREELDAVGLSDVRIIAPETSNVDAVAREMVDSIAADSQSLASIYAFATHSYNCCLTKEMRDKVVPYGKMYWQTEASSGDPEDFNNAPEAVKAVARALSDLNLGANIWMWFLAYDEFKATSNTPRLIGFDPQTATVEAFLKYYYFKQMSGVFRPGALLRFSTSSLSYEDDVQYGLDRYKYMENKCGQKPPLCAAACVNSDSTWAIGIANQTGIVSHWSAAKYAPAATYDVTIAVEELFDSTAVEFFVQVSNAEQRNIRTDTVSLVNGHVTIPVAPHELVTLHTNSRYAGRSPVVHGAGKLRPVRANVRAQVIPGAGGRYVSIAFALSGAEANASATLTACDVHGRRIAVIAQGVFPAGEHTVIWDRETDSQARASGVYIMRLAAGSMRSGCRVTIGK